KRRREDDEEDDRPKKRRRKDDEDEDDRPRRRPGRRSGLPAALIVGLSAGGVMLLGLVGIGAWWALSGNDEVRPQQVQANHAPPQNKLPDAVDKVEAPKAEKSKDPPVVIDPPRKEPPPPKKEPPRVAPPGFPPPAVEPPKVWTVKADPPAAAVKIPADFKKEIPAPGVWPELIVPAGPSPFVAIGSNRAAGEERQVWNLQTGEMTGKIVGQVQSTAHPVLSPDGAYLAFPPAARRGSGTVEVWALASGKRVTVSVGSTLGLDLAEFAGPGKLLVGRHNGNNMTVKVCDAATGQQEREFNTPRPAAAHDAVAVSPGGTYLAVIDHQNLHVFDVKTGTSAGECPLPKARPGTLLSCHGLSYSPDGGELAGLFSVANQLRVVCWDAARGEVVCDYTIPKALPQGGWTAVYRGHVLDWVGDRRGWLLYGYTFVDRSKNGTMTALPETPPLGSPVPRHLVGPSHAVTMAAGAKPTDRTLTVSAFDPDKPQ
ncbi:MAG TPA: hypothetical protein VFW33_15960, partial [Gemmataceae bacterium]|nr:hypothetical protein [Gemmataceae bacterium]